ncbi:membrane protease YdiL (CAAX protease family) [Catenuloplanes nepalensis]|uniref:Membrane protease YdiL (CAAX protease family) n=1 Tax=Catenuloplanes nepalensis TaxID=587533 RepID=A0ABT9MM82_9ACTN|nr:CPBP family intramembrane glutamic endopeptidase [Catenuloplanes nepalensis]MDP9792508.1 membrane protease YdiL (CAAX protease family) [Catenuloplanes nepalensis]
MTDNEVASAPPTATAQRATTHRDKDQPRPHLLAPVSPFRHFPGPTPVPYHRIGLPVRWWRTIAAAVAIIAVGYVAVPDLLDIAERALPHQQLPVLGGATALTISLFGTAMYLPVVLLAARRIERRRPGNVSSVAGWLRWPWLGLCLGAALLSQVVFVGTLMVLVWGFPSGIPAGAETPLPERQEPWAQVLTGGLIILTVTVFQCAAEEYLTRGWLLQTIRVPSPWPAIIFQAVAWTALHGSGPGPGSAGLLVYGLMLGWLTVHTGGLEAAIAKHVVHNGTAISLQILVGGLAPLRSSVQPAEQAADWITPTAWMASTAFYMAVVAVLTKAVHQWRDHSGPPAWAPPGTAARTAARNLPSATPA